MLVTTAGTRNIFKVVEHIMFAEIQKQAHAYFGLIDIRNDGIVYLPIPLEVSPLYQLSDNYITLSIYIIKSIIGRPQI